MNNFSKNKFLVLGLVFAAVLLVPANDAYADHDQYLKITTSDLQGVCGPDHGNDCRSMWLMPGDNILFELHSTGVYNPLDIIKVWIDTPATPSTPANIVSAEFGNEGGYQDGITVIKIGEGSYNITIHTGVLGNGVHTVKIDAIQNRNDSTRTIDGGDGYIFQIGPPASDTTPPTITFPSYFANGLNVTAQDSTGTIISLNDYAGSIILSDNVAIDTERGNYADIGGTMNINGVEYDDPIYHVTHVNGLHCTTGGNNHQLIFDPVNSDTPKFPIGQSEIKCQITDTSGNVGSASFTITVTEASADTTPPTFSTFPPNIITHQVADVCAFLEFSNTNEWRNSHPGLSDCEGTSAHQTSVWLQVIVNATDNIALVYDNVDDTVANYGYSSSGVYDAVTCTLDDGIDIPNQIDSKFNYDYDLGTHTVTCTASDTSGNSVTDSFTITVTEESDAWIQISSDKTTLDRNVTNQLLASIDVTYQNLNPVVDIIIQAPDGKEISGGSFTTNDSGTLTNWGIYEMPGYLRDSSFDSFKYIMTDGATRGELEFQLIGELPIFANSTPTNSTSTNSTSDPFTATVSYGVIDTEEAAPIPIGDCIGWKNLPLETQGRALWGPVKTDANYQPWAYYEGGMFYGVGHNISNWDDQECGIRSPVGDLLPGEYKWAALSEPESTPTSQNILQFSSSIIVEDTTPPVITVPNNIIASATLAGNQVVPFTVTATDNVGITGNINGQPYPYCTIPALTGSGTSGLSMTPSNMANGMDFQIGTTTVTCNVSDTSGNQSTASFTVTVIEDTDNVPTIPSSVTVTVPSNQVITTTNSSHAFTYAFSPTSSLGPTTLNNGLVCDYVPQSDTGLSLGQYNLYYYPDGESFHSKHGNTFSQQWESNGRWVDRNWIDDDTHFRTFPEGTTTVTCGSIVVDRGNDWQESAFGLWNDQMYRADDWMGAPAGPFQKFPVSSLNGTSSFDVKIIFDGDVDVVESITIQTDSTSYVEGELIQFSGNVSKIISDTKITLQLFKDGNLVEIAQIPVSADGNYSYALLAEGSLWQSQGDYVVKVIYGEGNVADTLFDYTPETIVNIDTIPPTLTQNQNITVDATITSNGAIVNYDLPQVTDDNSGVDLGPTCIPAPGSFFQTGITEVTCSASDWAGNVGTTSFTVFVESQIATPVEIITDVTLEIGQSQYTTDDSIFVTGIATPFTEDNVSIQVEDPLENIVLVEQVTPESSGVYTGIISPNFLWSTSGNYTMSATYGNSTSNTSFGFEFVEPVIDESISATGITLQTDASQYFIGDMIVIESALTDVGSGNEIHIFITDPNGNNVSIQSLNTDDSGFAILLLRVQDNWIPGEYSIRVMDWNSDLEETMTMDIVKPLPEITLSPTVTTTEDGNSITSYNAGDMAYFATSLLSESTSDVLLTINVVDADDTTLGVAFFKSIVGKGDSELVLGFKIPEDAADGTAKIYVNTYTDWIDQGGIAISSELVSEVNINGVIIEEPIVEEPVVEETVLPENTIPRLSSVSDIVQPASFTTGSLVSYNLPLATSGTTTLSTTCTPAPGSLFPIGSTQVTCTATNAVGNTGMTSFMVTINPIAQVTDQTLSVKVGNDSYNNLEPIFVTGSVGTVTGDPVNLEVRDTQNNLISIEQVSPKETGVYTVVLKSNELWNTSGEYRVIANYGDVIALDEFTFELEEVEEIAPEKIPTSLFIDTLDSAYVLGDVVAIGVNLVDAGAGEPVLLEVRDSNNDQVLLQSLNTDSDGIVIFFYQLDSTGESGVYSVTASSDEWNFSNSQNLVVVPQIPDITIGDVVPTLQDGTLVDSFESGDMGYFQTPVISESVSDVLITVNIFDVENTPLGLAHFNSMVVDDTFDIVLGLQIPQDAVPGLGTVYINTYTDWPNEGGVPILEEQVSFIEIAPASTTSLTVSSEEPEPVTVPELVPVSSNISVQTESTSYTTGNSIVISGTVENLAEYEQPVIIMIVSPAGNFVHIDQVLTDSSGNYSTTVNSGGKSMYSNGEYEVRAQYGSHKITTVFDFTRN